MMRFPRFTSNRWVSRDDQASELDEEIRAHFAMAVADRIARDEAPDEALAAARREFGNVTHVKEVTRETWGAVWLDRLGQDLRYAVRSLRRAPVFTAVAVATFAIGIGVNAAMFTVVRSVLLRPLPFRDADALYVISHAPDRAKSFVGPSMADREYLDFRTATRAFESTTSYNTYPATLLGAGEPVRLPTAGVTPSFFATLGIRPQLGRAFADGDDRPGANAIVVISAKLWRERFGADRRVIGRSVSVEGYTKTIVGVMPDGIDFPRHSDLWVPALIQLSAHNSRLQPVIGRLAPSSSRMRASAELHAFVQHEAERLGDRIPERATPEIIPLRDAVVGDFRQSLLIFTAAVALVLLIACANVSNLMLMRASARRHELGVRAALGAGRGRLVRQLLTESVVVALLGGVLGLLIAQAAVSLLLAFAPADLLPRATEIHIDPMVLLVMAGACVAAGIMSGAAPAIGVTRREVRESLGDSVRSTSRSPLRAIFVAAEASLALVLLVGAGLLIRSFVELQHVSLGYRTDHLVTATVDLPETQYRTPELLHTVQRRMSAQMAAIPGVKSVAAVNWLPLARTYTVGDFTREDGIALPPDYVVLKPCVTPEYFSVMGIRVREGRGFLPTDDATAARVVVIGEGVAKRLWPGHSAIGKRIAMADKPRPEDWMTIVGVVDDISQGGPAEPRAEAIYQSLAQVQQTFWINHLNFVVSTDGDPSAIASGMRAAIRAVDPRQPIESVMTMESRMSAVVAEPRFRSMLLIVFSALALVLAGVGIYGVVAFAVGERTREMGIRVALGAPPARIVRLVLRGTALLAVPGFLIGLAASLAATRVLRGFLFQVQPTDGVTFVAAGVVLFAVALAAGIGPARRAGHVDPVVVMK
jgi:predicted permease